MKDDCRRRNQEPSFSILDSSCSIAGPHAPSGKHCAGQRECNVCRRQSGGAVQSRRHYSADGNPRGSGRALSHCADERSGGKGRRDRRPRSPANADVDSTWEDSGTWGCHDQTQCYCRLAGKVAAQGKGCRLESVTALQANIVRRSVTKSRYRQHPSIDFNSSSRQSRAWRTERCWNSRHRSSIHISVPFTSFRTTRGRKPLTSAPRSAFSLATSLLTEDRPPARPPAHTLKSAAQRQHVYPTSCFRTAGR